jgi:hypothetical protein
MGRMNEAPLVEQAVALDSRQLLHAMLRHEAAMARALSELGLLPPAQAESIANTCKPVLFDVDQIWRETLLQQDTAAGAEPPLMVTLRESVALFNPQAAPAVFRGGLSEALQDNALLILTSAWWASVSAQLHALMRLLDKKQQPLQGLPVLTERLHLGVSERLQLQCPTQDPLAQAQMPALLQALAKALDMPQVKPTNAILNDQSDAWTSLGTDLVLLTLCLARIAQGLPASPRSPWGGALQAEAARLPLRLAQWVQERALATRPRDFWQAEWPLWTVLTGGAVAALNALKAGLVEEDQTPLSH